MTIEQRLLALAAKATPGPREKFHLDFGFEEFEWVRPDGSHVEVSADDEALIMALDPATVTALARVVEAARAYEQHLGGDGDQYRIDRLRSALAVLDALGKEQER